MPSLGRRRRIGKGARRSSISELRTPTATTHVEARAPSRSASTLLSQWPVAPLPVVPEAGPEEPPGVAPGLIVLSLDPGVLLLFAPVLSLPLALLASFGGRSRPHATTASPSAEASTATFN